MEFNVLMNGRERKGWSLRGFCKRNANCSLLLWYFVVKKYIDVFLCIFLVDLIKVKGMFRTRKLIIGKGYQR